MATAMDLAFALVDSLEGESTTLELNGVEGLLREEFSKAAPDLRDLNEQASAFAVSGRGRWSSRPPTTSGTTSGAWSASASTGAGRMTRWRSG